MSDVESPQTVEMTSEAPSPTELSATTVADTSATTTPTDADPLDGGTILSDTGEKPEGEEGDKPAEGDEGKADGDEGKEPDAPALTGAPEGDYDLAAFMPEGMAVDTEALGKIAPIAKELNLSNAGLAKIAAEGLPIVTKQVTDGIIGEVVQQRAAWEKDTRAAITGGVNSAGETVAADPIYGGKSFDDVTTMSAKALDRFGGAEFRDFLRTTGLGNHPAMVGFTYRVASLISEDSDFQRSGGIPNAQKTREEKYYGSN